MRPMKHKSKAPKKKRSDGRRSARLRETPSIEEGAAEVASARRPVADEYTDWLLSQRGTITPEADLEF